MRTHYYLDVLLMMMEPCLQVKSKDAILRLTCIKRGTLIISGSNVKNEYVEAEVMNTYIRKRVEIPTILETHARNTFENFKLSKEYIQEQDVLILTSQTHAKRACAIAKQFFSDYGCAWFKDLKLKHILREIISRIIYIKIEIQKKIGRY